MVIFQIILTILAVFVPISVLMYAYAFFVTNRFVDSIKDRLRYSLSDVGHAYLIVAKVWGIMFGFVAGCFAIILFVIWVISIIWGVPFIALNS